MDEILALEEGKIKFAKRKLRVQRCKAVTSSTVPAKRKTEKGTAVSPSSLWKSKTPTGGTITDRLSSGSSSTTPKAIPKGDPNLGKQLEHLSKEERKREKAANADRVARRLAKKQVKATMTKDKFTFGGGGRGKERVRGRKQGGVPGTSLSWKMKAKKTRVRSEANIAKRNIKK